MQSICNWKTEASTISIVTSNFFRAGIPWFPWIPLIDANILNMSKALPSPDMVLYFFGPPEGSWTLMEKLQKPSKKKKSVISGAMKVYNPHKARRFTTSNNHLLVFLFKGSVTGFMAGYLPKTSIKSGLEPVSRLNAKETWSSSTRWVHVYFLRHKCYHDIRNLMLNQTKGKLQLQTTP